MPFRGDLIWFVLHVGLLLVLIAEVTTSNLKFRRFAAVQTLSNVLEGFKIAHTTKASEKLII